MQEMGVSTHARIVIFLIQNDSLSSVFHVNFYKLTNSPLKSSIINDRVNF